jgi:hypothetical protein
LNFQVEVLDNLFIIRESSKVLLPCHLEREIQKWRERKDFGAKTGRDTKEKSKVATYCAVVLHLPPYTENRERG